MHDQNAIYLELNVDTEGSSVYVHSKHVPGLHLIGSNFQAMKPMVETAIKALFRDNRQMQVNVIWLTEFGVDAVCNVLERLAVVPIDQPSAAMISEGTFPRPIPIDRAAARHGMKSLLKRVLVWAGMRGLLPWTALTKVSK